MIVGRSSETEHIDAVVSAARRSMTHVLVLRGEAGIGKTELLRYAATTASDFRVLSVRAVEAESALPFALVSALARPLMAHSGALPAVQARSLRAASGEDDQGRADVFLLGAALVGLLTEAAREKPVLLLLDDVHWADEASLRAVLFALRRLEHDPVGALIACRDGVVPTLEASGFATLRPSRLGPSSVTALVTALVGYPPAPAVAGALAEATAGNPLALVELARSLGEAALTGRTRLPELLPVGGRLLDAYARQARELSPVARRALLVAACSAAEDAGPVLDAVRLLGGADTDFAEAERAGLVTMARGRISFVHPLMRTAVLTYADAVDRRAAHRALARSAQMPADERALHLGLAAGGPDDEAASALARAAESAARHGDHATAAEMWSRASEVVSDPSARAHMLTDAAEAAMAAGQTGRCRTLAQAGLRQSTDPHLRGRLLVSMSLVEADPRLSHANRLEAAALLAPYDVAAGMRALASSMSAGIAARSAELVRASVERAQALDRLADSSAAFHRDCVIGTGLALTGELAAALPTLAGVLDAIQRDGTLAADPATCAEAIVVAGYLGDVELAGSLTDQAVLAARRQGAMPLLADLLAQAAEVALFRADWHRATALFTESAEFARAMGDEDGTTAMALFLAGIDVHRGDGATAGDAARIRLRRAGAIGISRDRPVAARVLAILDMRDGQPQLALRRLLAEASVPFDGRGVRNGPLTVVEDAVEAALLCGNGEAAAGPVGRLSAYALVSPDPLASALAARCRAQLADGERALAEFRTALQFHERDPDAFATARTRLAFGEWLRRRGRRADSREQLYAALEIFDRLEATPWSDRARAELRATGESVGRREHSGVRLTPQELRIALVIADGITNREAAERLFVSVKTVEYHLGAVFRKLGVTSRTQLALHPLLSRTG